MSVYTYPQSQVIDEMTFRQSERGAWRAYLHARPGVDADTVQTVLDKLRGEGLECIPYDLDGKPTVEVRGFKHRSQLFAMVEPWTQGPLQTHKEKADHISWLDKLKKRTLQASGAFYVVGDYNFFTYGRKEARWEDMLAGAMYAAGTTSLLGYGRNDQSDIQVKDLSRRITRHLMKEGIKLDPKWALTNMAEEEHKGLLGKIDGTFRRYPSEMFSLFTGLAGACIAGSALRYKLLKKTPSSSDLHEQAIFKNPKELKIFRNAGFLDLGLGVMTMGSMALGGLVKERAHDPDRPKSEGIQAILDWVKEKPLTIAGAGLMVSTGLHAISSWLEYRQSKRLGHNDRLAAIKNRSWFVATNLAAEFLIAVSSKGHGEGIVSDTSVDTSVIALAADLIVRQPKDMEQHLIGYMADFLGRSDVLAMKNEEVTKLLRTQVEAMRQNPWAQANGVDKVAAPASPGVAAGPEIAAWQAKTAADPSVPGFSR